MDAVVSMYHVSIANVLYVPPRVPSGPVMYKLDKVVLAMGNFDVLVSASSLYICPEAPLM